MIRGKITFGVELECVKLTEAASSIMQTRGFSRHYDASILGHRGERLPETIEDGGGSEIITPIYSVGVQSDPEGKHMRLDYGNSMQAIQDLCACAEEVNTSCGIHIHLGRPQQDGKSLWKPEHVRNFLAICMLREEKFFSMVPPSRQNNRHCAPIKQRFTDVDLQSFYPLGQVMPRKSDNPKRYCWLNLIETRRKGTDPRPGRMASAATGTVEIRLLGNTRRFDYIWAWIQLWSKIAAYVAYTPSQFPIMHCVVTDSIASEIETVLRAKSSATGQDEASEAALHASEPLTPSRESRRRFETRPMATARPVVPTDIPDVDEPVSVRRRTP